MRILFYETKSYDKESFENTLRSCPDIAIEYVKSDLDPRTTYIISASCVFPVIHRKPWQNMPWLWPLPATAVCIRHILKYAKMISA